MARKPKPPHPDVGKRVRTPVWSDEWMQGDTHGEITTVLPGERRAPSATVLLDKSKRRVRYRLADLTIVS